MTEFGWLEDAIVDLIGTDEFLSWFDPARGTRGCVIVQWADGSAAIDVRTIENGDAIALTDCFFCSKCGARRVPDFRNVYRVIVGDAARIVCEKCYLENETPK